MEYISVTKEFFDGTTEKLNLQIEGFERHYYKKNSYEIIFTSEGANNIQIEFEKMFSQDLRITKIVVKSNISFDKEYGASISQERDKKLNVESWSYYDEEDYDQVDTYTRDDAYRDGGDGQEWSDSTSFL